MRQGLYSKMLWSARGVEDDVAVANVVAAFEEEYKPEAVFIDMGGGTGVVSAGKAMGHKNWLLVSFAEASSKNGILNKRAEMYYDAKDHMKNGGAIPDDPILAAQLAAPQRKGRLDGKECLEDKEEIIKRTGESPGRADAYILTFAHPVVARSERERRKISSLGKKKTWDPLTWKPGKK